MLIWWHFCSYFSSFSCFVSTPFMEFDAQKSKTKAALLCSLINLITLHFSVLYRNRADYISDLWSRGAWSSWKRAPSGPLKDAFMSSLSSLRSVFGCSGARYLPPHPSCVPAFTPSSWGGGGVPLCLAFRPTLFKFETSVFRSEVHIVGVKYLVRSPAKKQSLIIIPSFSKSVTPLPPHHWREHHSLCFSPKQKHLL